MSQTYIYLLMWFITFQEFYKGFCKNLKKEGLGDTENHNEISGEDFEKFIEFLILMNKIIESPKDTPGYWDLINELPTEYRNSYHKPLQWGLQFIVMISTAKRGREGNMSFI